MLNKDKENKNDKHYEIERKFLIKKESLPKNLKEFKCKKIVQGFLSLKPCLRLRKIENEYFFTIKTKPKEKFNTIDDLVRNEYEIPISKKTYNELIKKCEGIILYKTRYYIPYGNHTIELDIFDKDFKGLIYAECEFDNINDAKKFIIPEWFYKDVTGIKKYKNTELSVCKNIKNVLKY